MGRTEFDEHLEAWRSYTTSPWGRLRYAVVRTTLAREVARLGGGPLRVLDAGGGDGLDALPLARAGHDVTLLDPSEPLLASARETADRDQVHLTTRLGGLDDVDGGDFDLVLCHFVLQYRPAGDADLRRLVAAVRPGGLLSLIAINPAARVLATAVRSGPSAALAELGADTEHAATFDTEVRKVDPDEVAEELSRLGAPVVARYGGRIVNDLLTDEDAKRDPSYYADLERLELALCDREPYCRIGTFWQLIGQVTEE